MKNLMFFIIICYATFLYGQDIKVENEYYLNKTVKRELTSQKGNPKAYLKNYYESGQLKSQGWLFNNKKDLYWVYYFENGVIKAEGDYLKDKKTGYWKDYHFNGVLKAEGHFKNGNRTDWWIFYDELEIKINEGHYTGEVKNGFHHIYHDGKPKYAGHYVEGIRKGTWVTLNKQGEFIAIEEYGD